MNGELACPLCDSFGRSGCIVHADPLPLESLCHGMKGDAALDPRETIVVNGMPPLTAKQRAAFDVDV